MSRILKTLQEDSKSKQTPHFQLSVKSSQLKSLDEGNLLCLNVSCHEETEKSSLIFFLELEFMSKHQKLFIQYIKQMQSLRTVNKLNLP